MTDARLIELREHVDLNYTTDARVAIAWALHEIERLRAVLGGIAACATRCTCCETLSQLAREATTRPGACSPLRDP